MPFKKNDSRDTQQSVHTKHIFISRDDQLNFFLHHIFEPEDPSYNIVSIWGQGGVGKTTLVSHLIDQAHASQFKDYCITALVNEKQTTPASVMERFADHLKHAGYPLKKFEEEYIRFKDALRRYQIGHRNEQEVIVREAVDLAGTVVDDVPFVGGAMHKGASTVTELLLERRRIQQYLRDAARLENPIGDLTKAFVQDLNLVADSQAGVGGMWIKPPHRIVLFLDTFEQLAVDIVPWLLDHFLELTLSSNVVLVIIGRDSVATSLPEERKRWSPWLDNDTIYVMSLNAFTTEETRAYLERRGITDPKRVHAIQQVSRGLPLYLSILTTDPQGKIDPTAQVVENFLHWIPKQEGQKRRLALDASLFSMPFNQDDLAAFTYTGDQQAELYTWLIGQHFIQRNTEDGRHSYHEVAQEHFSRYLYQRSLEDYFATRRMLASYYQRQVTKMQTEHGKEIYESPRWQAGALALIQQLFLLPDEESHMRAAEYVVRFYEHTTQDEALLRVLRPLSQNTDDNQTTTGMHQLIKNLLHLIESDSTDQHQQRINAIDFLLEKMAGFPSCSTDVLAYMYNFRARVYREIGDYMRAFADFDQARTLASDYANIYYQMGLTHYYRGEYQQALTDYNQALAFDEHDAQALVGRGATYRVMKRYPEALADFDKSLVLDEHNPWAWAERGATYREMERYPEALADLDKSLALNEHNAAVWAQRGVTYRVMKRYPEALADLDKSLALDEHNTWVWVERGFTYHMMNRYPEALADYDQALALDKHNVRALVERGATYQMMKRSLEALADLNKSLVLDEHNVLALVERGATYREMERYPEALADLERALALNEHDASAWAWRGATYRAMERYPEALADLNKAIALNENDAWAWASHGATYLAMGDYQRAFADLDRVIALDNKESWYWYLHALIHLLNHQRDAFTSSLQEAMTRAQNKLKETDENSFEHHRAHFEITLYRLVNGDEEEAERMYNTLCSTCQVITRVQRAARDIKEFLHIQPEHQAARHILDMLQTRIRELEQEGN